MTTMTAPAGFTTIPDQPILPRPGTAQGPMNTPHPPGPILPAMPERTMATHDVAMTNREGAIASWTYEEHGSYAWQS